MLVTKRSSQIGQSSIERKTYNKELGFGVMLLASLTVFSTVLTEKPSVEDVSMAFIEDIPKHLHSQYTTMMNELLTNDPTLVSDVTRWAHALQGLSVHQENTQ